MRAAVLGVAFDTVPDRLPRRGILFLPLPAATLAKNDRRATCGDVTTFSAVAPCSGRRAHPSIQCSESPPNMITQHHLRLRQSCDPPKILPLCVLFATVSSNLHKQRGRPRANPPTESSPKPPSASSRAACGKGDPAARVSARRLNFGRKAIPDSKSEVRFQGFHGCRAFSAASAIA
jgi:hypothetical protein